MPVLIARLKAAWSVLIGRERIFVRATVEAAQVDLWRLNNRLVFATQLLKDLPAMLIDDINALAAAVDTALAAKDAAAAGTVADLATANATIDTLNGQIADADAAVVALTAKLAPAPMPAAPVAEPVPVPVIDPNTGQPVAA